MVNNEDPGGITQTEGERVPADGVELPDGVSAEDAAKFTQVLNKLIGDNADMKKDGVIKALKAMAKTKRTKTVINWRGGGGFQVAHLAPACFDYDEALNRVVLSPEATGDLLIRSVAANLGFALIPSPVNSDFDGRKGKVLLKVVEGVAIVDMVDWLVSRLQPDETVLIAALSVMDGVRETLRRNCKGSRIVVIPDDVFRYSKEGGEA